MPRITIAEHDIAPGERRRLEIPVARLVTETWLSLPVEVVNGKRPGPTIWLSAAVHGDELNGVEIIRQVLDRISAANFHGCLIAVPIVNVFGFVEQSRYLPDRRDLNRSFPGSPRGSLASRLAHLFMTEIVSRCQYGIDLHTAAAGRTNLPQIRGNLADPETRRCAEAFAAPVMIHSETRDGSLREAATRRGIHVLLYEAGEPLRFDEEAIATGVRGVLRVLAALKMTRRSVPGTSARRSVVGHTTRWVRSPHGGILRLEVQLGQRVEKRQRLGSVADAFGDDRSHLTAPCDGLVIGLTVNPLVHQGDAVVHLARTE